MIGPRHRRSARAQATVRRLEPADVPAAAAAGAAAFGIDPHLAPARERWLDRVAHVQASDPEGCFVAERGKRIVGVAEVLRREGMWILSLLAVDPAGQSAGAGRALMRRALEYGPADAPGLVISSNDARALRLYALSGFALRPTLQASGLVDHRLIAGPASAVREDPDPDLEALAAVSRAVRGAPHTRELAFALARGARLLRWEEEGFAVVTPGQGLWLLVAREEEVARALLWAALAATPDGEPFGVRWILAENGWAAEVTARAGLRLTGYGAVCVRGAVGPLRCYLPSAPFA